MVNRNKISQFNPALPEIMHIDINSCFATIEQQANRFLRGKPVIIAPYRSEISTVIAASIEAKALGIKGGMKVFEAKNIYPGIIVVEPDPWKYRTVHLKLRKLLSLYTDLVVPKSIDEFVLNMKHRRSHLTQNEMVNIGCDIKTRIQKEIGECIYVSIGISTNRYLSKVASNLKKPNGLEIVDITNYLKVYSRLQLTELPGIKARNALRLNKMGIYTTTDLYAASEQTLRFAFHSINGHYWYLRIRGWEIDDYESERKSFGHSYVLKEKIEKKPDALPILYKLIVKMAFRLRKKNYQAKGLSVAFYFKDNTYWNKSWKLPKFTFYSYDFYTEAKNIFEYECPDKPLKQIAVSCFDLTNSNLFQDNLFENLSRKKNLSKALDNINIKWGDFVIKPAVLCHVPNSAPDRISFGGIKDLDGF